MQEEAGDEVADASLQVFVPHHHRSPQEQIQQFDLIRGGEGVAGEAEEQRAGLLQSLGQFVRHTLLQVDSGEVGEESDEERRVRETVHLNTQSLLVVHSSLRRGGNRK